MTRKIILAMLLLGACTVSDGDDPSSPPDDPPATQPTTPTPTMPTTPTTPTTTLPGEPVLIDADHDGALDTIDVEPDGDGDYAYVTDTCGNPLIDANHDGRIEAIDLDCNGQIDLLVAPNATVTPAPGANCFAGTPGQGPGHGAAGVGCN